MHASCCHDPECLVEEVVLSLRCHARCCCDSQNALVEEGGAIPALPCKLAAVVIQNALVEEGVLSLRCHASKLLS
jgi:hypothetical protein